MDAATYEQRLASLSNVIGNTPLLAIDLTIAATAHRIYAKAEHLNMTGSIKDRMALHILARGLRAAATSRPGDTIAEATSGNTGISFAAIGRALGHPVTHLHARLDEPRADRPDPQLRRRRSSS